MKTKHLVSALQALEGFEKPRLELEQYSTPPEIAGSIVPIRKDPFPSKLAAILEHIAEDVGDDDLQNCLVADLGCGTGVLLIGSAFINAGFVLGVDIDPKALAICRRNIQANEQLVPVCDLLQMDLRAQQMPQSMCGRFDVVLTNPPFGTKNSEGADVDFVEAGLRLAKPDGGRVYSLHKTSTRQFLERRTANGKWSTEGAVRADCLAQMRWPLARSFGFHRQRSVDIHVDLFRFRRIP